MKKPIRIVIAILAAGLVGVLVYSHFHDNRYVRVENGLESRPDDALDVAFVGNSHTYVNSVPRMVQLLVPDGEQPMWFHSSTSSGKSLRWHVLEGEALEVLKSEEWDVVVMQPASTEPLGMPDSMRRHAREIAAASSARPIVFMPWARHPAYGSEIYRAQWYAPNYDIAVDGIMNNVKTIGLEIAPVGLAWQLAMEETDVELYHPDGNHATRAGGFLAALVIYATIYDADPRETTWVPPGISEEQANTLRGVAAASVQ